MRKKQKNRTVNLISLKDEINISINHLSNFVREISVIDNGLLVRVEYKRDIDQIAQLVSLHTSKWFKVLQVIGTHAYYDGVKPVRFLGSSSITRRTDAMKRKCNVAWHGLSGH